MIFETTTKFLIVFVRLILGKVWVDGFPGPQREIDVRYEFVNFVGFIVEIEIIAVTFD